MVGSLTVSGRNPWYRRAPELPLSYQERERLIPYIVSVYGRSLAVRDFRTKGHPKFDDYARGVMASEMTPWFIRGDAHLLRRTSRSRSMGWVLD